jgi:phosphomevalonate kinase
MTPEMRASAPGKLVLLGEYAVLFGSPAVAMAVARRARVTATPSPVDHWVVAAPGFMDRAVGFEVHPSGGVHWRQNVNAERLELVEELFAGWRSAVGSPVENLPPLALELDTTRFFASAGGERRKLGLGSSAALTAALASVLVGWAGGGRLPLIDLRWVQQVVALHRSIQGGLGSGIDVAASLLGGVVEFRLDAAQRVSVARPLSLPEHVHLLCVWTGRAASTGSFLERLETRRATHPKQVESALRALGSAAAGGVTAIGAADVPALLDAVEASWAGFEELGTAIEMPIVSEAHRRLREIAGGCGVRYKPSGAGGGDFGIAFSDDPERLRELARRVAAAGFSTPGLEIDARGLHGQGM